MDILFYVFSILAISSLVIGFTYGIVLEKKIKDKTVGSNRLERLDALQFAYYLMAMLFTILAIGSASIPFN